MRIETSLAGSQGTDVGHNLPDSLAQSRAFVVDQGHDIVPCLQTTREGYGSTSTNYDCNKLGIDHYVVVLQAMHVSEVQVTEYWLCFIIKKIQDSNTVQIHRYS